VVLYPWLPTIWLLLTLAILLYLTALELRPLRPNYLWWIWCLLFVFLTHVVGYLILRLYVLLQRRNARKTGP